MINRSAQHGVPVVAALLVALTYLLVQGTAPDPARHDRTLDALRSVMLHSAALQRDVLQARGGPARQLRPVRPLDGEAARGDAGPADGARGRRAAKRGRTSIARSPRSRAAVREQEALVEAFKSDNALLRNSLAYFIHMSGRLAETAADAPAGGGGRARLTMAMLRFVDEPRPDAAARGDRGARPPGAAARRSRRGDIELARLRTAG